MVRTRRLVLLLTVLAGACGGRPTYQLEGQILAVDPVAQTLTIKHGDIDGLMPGMTMAFKVAEPGLMQNKEAGDLVRASLVLDDSRALLTSVVVTGHDALRDPPPARPSIDLLDPGEEVPDVALIDQDGQPKALAGWRGEALAVTFVYTRCPLPDFCPAMDRRFAATARTIAGDPALAGRVHLLSVTVDPAYDTPAVLQAHARALGADPARWTFATGRPAELERFASRFGVAVLRDDPAGRELVHNLRTAVIDGRGHLVTILGGSDWTVDELVRELRRASATR